MRSILRTVLQFILAAAGGALFFIFLTVLRRWTWPWNFTESELILYLLGAVACAIATAVIWWNVSKSSGDGG
jgi:hypothetical protein